MLHAVDSLWGLMTYATVMTLTPGPNNLLLLSSGLNFGLHRTGWHIAGILSGTLLQICVTGAGLGALFALAPEAQLLLKLTGSLYMLWLAQRLWVTSTVQARAVARPIRYGEAMTFQFINPKVWIMSTTVIAAFVPAGDGYAGRVVSSGLIFVAVALPCISLWAASGAGLRALIQKPAVLRQVNRGLALLSAMTAILFWI